MANHSDITAIDADGRAFGWGGCESGTLAGLGDRQRQSRRRAEAGRLAGLSAVAVAAVAAVVTLGWPTSGPAPVATITCEQCKAQFAEYNAHLTEDRPMSDQDYSEVRRHLAECEYCRKKFFQLYPGALEAAAATAATLLFLTRRRVYG